MSKNAKKNLLSECDLLHIALLARCKIWAKPPKSVKNHPKQAINLEITLIKIFLDKFSKMLILTSYGTNPVNIKRAAVRFVPYSCDMHPKSVV